jgi:hypothetical protein
VVALVAPALAVAALAAGSITWSRDVQDRIQIDGTGCGQPGSATIDLPAGAFDVSVSKPKVGTTDGDARVTDVNVAGSKVTVTAVGAGDSICDPGEDERDPSTRPWVAGFDYRIAFTTRVTVAVQRDWARRRPIFVVKPSSVRIAYLGAVERIRWQRYGGATAIGFGRMNEDGWPGPDVCKRAKCLSDGKRVKVVLRNPSYCTGDDHVFYGRVSFITTGRIGVIKPGREFAGNKPHCGSFPAIPVR